jgi:hypothetical protein
MSAATSLTVRVPLTIRHRPGRKTVITPEPVTEIAPAAAPTYADAALVKAVARAHRWKRLLESGQYASLGELAASEKLDRGYLGRILQLTLLAPDLVEDVLNGRQPSELSLPRLIAGLEPSWAEQRRLLADPADIQKEPPHEPHYPHPR